MRHAKPATSPNVDQQMYVIFRRHQLGAFAVERDVADMNRAATLSAIAGDPQNILAVIEFNAVEGTSRDATSDLAADLADLAANEGLPISPKLHDFICDFAGIDHARGLRVFDPSFKAA